MRQFLQKFLLFFVMAGACYLVPVAWRVVYCHPRVDEAHHIEPWQKILFIGDSHIGCTFVESPEYRNRIIWESSMPQQFTWIRLLEMERRGLLRDVETLVLDIGLQSIGQQKRERMKEFWWRMIPLTYRHRDVLPLSAWDCISQFALNPHGRIHIANLLPEANTSVLSRTQEERTLEFGKMAVAHFGWIDCPELMCNGWEKSLKEAIKGIYDICKRNNIRVIFFTAPLTSYYVDAIPERVNAKLHEFTSYISELGIPYYDLRDWGNDDDFRDSFHFRLDGARKFTEWFYRNILRYEGVARGGQE